MRGALITGAVILVLAWLLSLADWTPEQIGPLWEIAVLLAGVGSMAAWLVGRPKYTCSYVGTDGVARFACCGSRSSITLSEVFRFETATSLRVSVRNIYVNGCYLKTEYSFRWFDDRNAQRYKLAGIYRRSKTGGPPDDPYHLAQAAEVRWTNRLFPDVLSTIEKGGTWQLRAGRGRYLGIGPEYLEFRGRRYRYEDLDLKVERGFIVLRSTGDKRAWYKLDRAPRVRYAELENALLAVCLVARMTDKEIPVQSASDARYHLLHFAPP